MKSFNKWWFAITDNIHFLMAIFLEQNFLRLFFIFYFYYQTYHDWKWFELCQFLGHNFRWFFFKVCLFIWSHLTLPTITFRQFLGHLLISRIEIRGHMQAYRHYWVQFVFVCWYFLFMLSFIQCCLLSTG